MFGGFPSFGGPSLLGSVFEFDDPFFRDPFGHMEQVMQAHTRAVTGPLGRPVVPQAAHHSAMPNSSRSQPVIEELTDADEEMHARTGSHAAVVEEPDDDAAQADRPFKRKEPDTASRPASHAHVDRRHAPNHPLASSSARQVATQHSGLGGRSPSLLDAFFGGSLTDLMQAPLGQGGTGGYSYSSTTYTSSGPGGVTYQSSHTERVGPGGVREVQSSVRDGRTGHQSMTITRGLGDKEKTMTRTRDATGKMQSNEMLRGLEDDEAARFDSEWMDHAERSLLRSSGGGFSGAVRSGSRTGGANQPYRAPLQLPAPPAQPAPRPTYQATHPAHAAIPHNTFPDYRHGVPTATQAPVLTRQPSDPTAGAYIRQSPAVGGRPANAYAGYPTHANVTGSRLPTHAPSQTATAARSGGYGGYNGSGSGTYTADGSGRYV